MDTTLLSIHCYTILQTITHNNEIAIYHSNIFNYTWLLLKCNSATPSSPLYFILLLLHYFITSTPLEPTLLDSKPSGHRPDAESMGLSMETPSVTLVVLGLKISIISCYSRSHSYHQRQLSFDFLLILHLYISISFLHTPFQRLFTVSAQSPQK